MKRPRRGSPLRRESRHVGVREGRSKGKDKSEAGPGVVTTKPWGQVGMLIVLKAVAAPRLTWRLQEP